MKGLHIAYSTVFGMALVLGQVGASHATPIDIQTLDYNGAVLSIDGEWQSGSVFQVTYKANLDNFLAGEGEDFLAAIDWKWVGAQIKSISLLSAPTDPNDWQTQPFYQIDFGEDVGCAKGGGQGAVCTEYVGREDAMLSMSLGGEFSWVFEVTFKHARQGDWLRNQGPRVGYQDGLASPLGIIATAAPLNGEVNGQVPEPGALSLLLMGLAGMLLGRRRQRAV
jgi:hypothetical protein